jgi:hypothetical protein
MAIEWKAKICSGMDVVEKIKFIKQGTDSDGNKVTASSVYVPSGDDMYKTRSEWSDSEINAIADKVSDELDNAIKSQGGS